MLTRLAISNLATIESLAIDFQAGFTVLTGETGAGKSILIDAIRFVLGEPGSTHQLRSGAKQILVEAAFDLSALPEVTARLNELDIPSAGELTLRRLLQENGRSRALANDCAITQARLEQIGQYLVNIHGQHDHQMLLNPASHTEFLDSFAGLLTLRDDVGAAHGDYTRPVRERKALREQASQRARRREELAMMLADLEAARLSPGEEESLRNEHTVLTHAEQLAGLLASVCESLYEGEAPIAGRLRETAQLLGQAAAIDPRLAVRSDQIEPLRYQLEDLYQALRTYAAGLEADPARLEAVNARLAELEKIKRKHGDDVSAVLERMRDAERELAELGEVEDNLEALDRRINEVAGQLHALSVRLSKRRIAAALRLDRQVMAQLAELGMKQAAFKTQIKPLQSPSVKAPSYSQAGVDAVEFLLSTSPGQVLRPLSQIASGGELSRIMLALKTVLARADPTKTLIFDEVDAGIGGNMAEIVGRKLRALGTTHQVLCVTHLPQIAALGSRHVLVTKIAENGQTYTHAEPLGEQEKVQEVARLLSGINISSHSLASAQEMVERSREAGV